MTPPIPWYETATPYTIFALLCVLFVYGAAKLLQWMTEPCRCKVPGPFVRERHANLCSQCWRQVRG